jgi:hypothetical protein
MPISKAALAGLGLLALAACEPAGSGAARTTVSVAGQRINIAAPPGFCVDPRSTNVTPQGAFVLVSDCGLLGNRSRAATETIGAAMTASISTQGLGAGGTAQSLAEVEHIASTAEGRADLGRSGQAGRVRILTTQTQGDVLYILVEDRGPQPVAGVEPQFWRAFLEVKGRITALSVLGFQGSGVSPQQSLSYLASFATAIQQANR